MNELPGESLRIYDTSGTSIAVVHFHLTSDTRLKGECIFQLVPDWDASTCSEARWIAKRRFEKVGEHRFRVDGEGVLAIHSGDFRIVLHPDDEGGLRTHPPLPPIHAMWEA